MNYYYESEKGQLLEQQFQGISPTKQLISSRDAGILM